MSKNKIRSCEPRKTTRESIIDQSHKISEKLEKAGLSLSDNEVESVVMESLTEPHLTALVYMKLSERISKDKNHKLINLSRIKVFTGLLGKLPASYEENIKSDKFKLAPIPELINKKALNLAIERLVPIIEIPEDLNLVEEICALFAQAITDHNNKDKDNINSPSYNGLTPIMYAHYHSQHNYFIRDHLLELGADIKVKLKSKYLGGESFQIYENYLCFVALHEDEIKYIKNSPPTITTKKFDGQELISSITKDGDYQKQFLAASAIDIEAEREAELDNLLSGFEIIKSEEEERDEKEMQEIEVMTSTLRALGLADTSHSIIGGVSAAKAIGQNLPALNASSARLQK